MIEISDSLKNHYLFEYPIVQLIDLLSILFKEEKIELNRRQNSNLSFYVDSKFSPTIYSISDMVVYKYFNDKLSFAERCFIKSIKFKDYPFYDKIIELENQIKSNS